jgi:hypothetical protein
VFRRLFNILVLVALSLGLSACAKVYVDNSLGDPDYASFKKSANPQPIQVLFEFQTEGVSNAGGTISARPKVRKFQNQECSVRCLPCLLLPAESL